MEIEKDIPIPNEDHFKYPFEFMEIGDSFFLPLNGVDSIRIRNNVYSSAKKYAAANNMKFAVRYMKHQGGVRCWREK